MTKDNVFWALGCISAAALFGVAIYKAHEIDTDNRHNARCERVLRCLSTGDDRLHCDAAYPGCEAENASESTG